MQCIEAKTVDGRRVVKKKNCELQIVNNPHKIIVDTDNWIKISGTFTANGGEEYITIGNFSPEKATPFKVVKEKRDQSAYYFIDDVILAKGTQPVAIEYKARKDAKEMVSHRTNQMEASDYFKQFLITTEAKTTKSKPKEIPKEPILLNNIFFMANDYTILPNSEKELMNLVSFMKSDESLKIKIIGHTDENGTVEFNQKLSEDRAKIVYNFLLMEDVPTDRLSFEGKGNTDPITEAKTEFARNKNRRVEFQVSR